MKTYTTFSVKFEHNGKVYYPGVNYNFTKELSQILKKVEQIKLKEDGNNRSNKRNGRFALRRWNSDSWNYGG